MQFSRYVFAGVLLLLPALTAAQVPPTSPPKAQATGTIASPLPQAPAATPTLSAVQTSPTASPQPQATGAIASPAPQAPVSTPTLSTTQPSPTPVPQPPAMGTIVSPMPLRSAVTPIAPARLCSDGENAPGRTLDDLKQIIASCRTVIRNQAGTISDQRHAITLLVATTTSLTKTTNKALQVMRKRPTQSCKPSNHSGNNNAAPIRQQSKP